MKAMGAQHGHHCFTNLVIVFLTSKLYVVTTLKSTVYDFYSC